MMALRRNPVTKAKQNTRRLRMLRKIHALKFTPMGHISPNFSLFELSFWINFVVAKMYTVISNYMIANSFKGWNWFDGAAKNSYRVTRIFLSVYNVICLNLCEQLFERVRVKKKYIKIKEKLIPERNALRINKRELFLSISSRDYIISVLYLKNRASSRKNAG